MPHLLKNKQLELLFNLPFEHYQLSRFDWTGKIAVVKFQNRAISSLEIPGDLEGQYGGSGFYNEFGIDSPLGFEEAKIGDWFHKIGIGLLRKDDAIYRFNQTYEIQAAEFNISKESGKIRISCTAPLVQGYAYVLEKEIELLDSGFVIKYHLRNTGEKTMATNEYNHNFLAIDNDLIGRHYRLRFPFPLKPGLLGEIVNPEKSAVIGEREISFDSTPQDPFFFSQLSGGEQVDARWELINYKSKLGISETGSFPSSLVNIWGCKHVISPELFFNIILEARQSVRWSRTYQVFHVD